MWGKEDIKGRSQSKYFQLLYKRDGKNIQSQSSWDLEEVMAAGRQDWVSMKSALVTFQKLKKEMVAMNRRSDQEILKK